MAPNAARDFGRYELVSKLASGGMAVTYRATMRGAAGVTKPVVIKQILPHFADDPAFVEMFISEARVAAALTHGNIAQVFDFGEIDGQYFLAMEFVHGQPLSKVLRRAQRAGLPSLPIPLALYIASQICDGLDYAHRHLDDNGEPLGLVHRDVSPDNVLISYEGQVKVIDFGIAKATSVVEGNTSPGMVKGKYPYFSTEQARGEQDLDARSDTFAVGVVLYEMLCGRRPYDGDFVTVLPKLLAGDYPRPSSLNPAIAPEVELVLATAMALEREQRYPTAQAFSEALREQLYSAWPRFSPSMASQLLGHLFAEDLAAEGRRVEVTPAFLEQLAEWQQQTSVGPRPASAGTGRPRSRPASDGEISGPMLSNPGARPPSSRSGSNGVARASQPGGVRPISSTTGRRVSSAGVVRVPAASPPREAPAPETMAGPLTDARVLESPNEPHDNTPLDIEVPSVTHITALEGTPGDPREQRARQEKEREEKQRRMVRQLSIPLFALALLGLLYLVFSPKKASEEEAAMRAPLWLTSTPPGATVKLNGKDVPGVTPLFVPDVPIYEASTFVLTLPGYRTWTKRFTPTAIDKPTLNAVFEPLEEQPPPQAAPPPEPAAAPEQPDLSRNEVDYPTRLFVLRPRYNAFVVDGLATASLELNPRVAYAVSTDGSASLAAGRGGGTGTLAYFAEGDDLPADESFGLLGPSTRTLKGVRRLHVFLLDDDLADNSGTVRVNLRQSQFVAPRSLTFDATRDALVLAPEQQFVLRGLNPDAIYMLTVRDDVAELRVGPTGRTRHVLCVESNQKSARRSHRLLESGKRFQVTGADTLRCAFPDVRVEDNAGAFEVDIVDVTEMSRKERADALRGPLR
ncbi:serine/threonine-protein kinase [Cystobacter fuscus]|uniref:serine/threonine-protein kinase n=1 Tax=Cystobacter fuscus TaxID=43 RepID=UPI001E404706|nr:serine/threonine-protein kinase [Cystobacter fuscus]